MPAVSTGRAERSSGNSSGVRWQSLLNRGRGGSYRVAGWLVYGFLALALHAAALVSIPPEWGERAPAHKTPRDLQLTMLEGNFSPEDWAFVHVNPDIPAQDPGETARFSTKDQIAAQEVAPDEDTPEGLAQVEGPLPDSAAVFTGRPDAWPFPTSPDSPSEDEDFSDPTAFAESTIPPLQMPDAADPLPPEDEGTGLAWFAGEAEEPSPVDGLIQIPVNLPEDRLPETREMVDELPEEADDGTEVQRRRPAPRPRTQIPYGPPLVLGQQDTRVSRIGRAAVEARETPFGHYMDRMTEAIVNQWHRMAREMGLAAESGSLVAVTFTLYADGEIGEIIIRESTTRGVLGMLIIEDAIRSRAPYGPWTEEMRALHGEKREVSMRFFYR